MTSAANTVSQLPAAPSSTAVPSDGRLRGNGFAATVLGVAAGPRTATERPGPGQQLWQFGLTATTSPPANGGAPVNLTAVVVVGSVTVPVPLPAPPADGGTIGPLWFQASLPSTTGPGGDVILSLTAAGDTQTFSLAHMARTGAAPAASYRDPTNSTVTTTPAAAVDIPESFADGFANHASTYPIHVALKTVTLGYFAPDTPNHPAASPTGAWLWVTLSSDGTHSPDQDPYSDPYLIIKQAVAASAVTLTVRGKPAEASTVVPGGGGDTGTNNTPTGTRPTCSPTPTSSPSPPTWPPPPSPSPPDRSPRRCPAPPPAWPAPPPPPPPQPTLRSLSPSLPQRLRRRRPGRHRPPPPSAVPAPSTAAPGPHRRSVRPACPPPPAPTSSSGSWSPPASPPPS
ncbi:MAG: hypothetical protein M3Y91_02875 [Actinomycetota bacterium]|nr:hypothetical protein [Actinomycetota bacterium]